MIKKILFCLILFSAFSVFAQKAMQYNLPSPSALLQFPKQDKQQLLDEDEKNGKGRLRCAVLMPCDVAFPADDVLPETIAEGKVWRMTIEAEDAEAINLYLEDFQLPKGAELSFYTPDFTYRLPTITSDENPENKIYVTDHVQGGNFIVELFVPHGVEARHCFTIKDIGYMYRPLPRWMSGSRGFGGSGGCEVNVNCPEGEKWQDEKKGVARILLLAGGGLYYCSGSLINNTRNDKTPYFLTAFHCGEGATEEEFLKWKFYFNYESPSCENPEEEPEPYTTTGSEKIAEGVYPPGSDFLLLKLSEVVSLAPNIFFNGWNISTTPANSGVGIHHPEGDIKKISTYTKKLQDDDQTHWILYWAQTPTNWGVTEGGSSGSPIFDQNKYIVGTLTGGSAECAAPQRYDYYGQMAYHWDKNGADSTEQLKPWLDPDNTGITTLQGLGEEKPVEIPLVRPNPTTGLLLVKLEKGDNKELNIFDVMGRLVMKKKISVVDDVYIMPVDLSHLSVGLYIMVITGDNGRKTHKIVKI